MFQLTTFCMVVLMHTTMNWQKAPRIVVH
uniref:Uncharacterized protein n=1 Tax=Arundo donax TaxID=35708 RepID=A0A0A9F5M4_ARUDO